MARRPLGRPGKILAVGRNYPSHLNGRTQPTKPEFFFKPPSAVVGDGEAIVLPADPAAPEVHAEGELVVVIGRTARNVPVARALEHVAGYTCGNDVTAQGWKKVDLQWWRAKGADTFAPLGPWLDDAFDPTGGRIRTLVNGEVVQEGPFSDMAFDIPQLIAFASEFVTLEPGDVLFTGTPGTTRAMKPGDVVEVEVPGLGVLRNPVAGPP